MSLCAVAFALAVVASPLDENGLQVGEYMGAFEPHHVTGPDAGTDTCPVCEYINRPMVQVWTNGSQEKWLAQVAPTLERATKKNQPYEFKSFVIQVIDADREKASTAQELKNLAQKDDLSLLALTYLDRFDEAVAAHQFRLDASSKNVIFVYVNRKIEKKFVNFEPTRANLQTLSAAMDSVAKKSKKR